MKILASLMLATGSLAAQDLSDHAMHQQHGEAMPPLPEVHEVQVDFELLDRNGRRVTDEDFHGQYVLLTFGFTHCAHICPLVAHTMASGLREIDRDAAGIFVSVDTERDTPAATDDYARRFGERMLGLGGDYQRIRTVADNFNVSYAVTKTNESYTVQHTANIYVIDPQGRLVEALPLSASVSDIIALID